MGLTVSADHVFVLRGRSPRLEVWSLDGKQEIVDDLGSRLGPPSDGSAMSVANGELLVLDASASRIFRFRLQADPHP